MSRKGQKLLYSRIGNDPVLKAVMADSGRYECHLSNEMGHTTGICNVEVHKIFKPPFFSRQMNNIKQLVNCDARYKQMAEQKMAEKKKFSYGPNFWFY